MFTFWFFATAVLPYLFNPPRFWLFTFCVSSKKNPQDLRVSPKEIPQNQRGKLKKEKPKKNFCFWTARESQILEIFLYYSDLQKWRSPENTKTERKIQLLIEINLWIFFIWEKLKIRSIAHLWELAKDFCNNLNSSPRMSQLLEFIWADDTSLQN